MKYYPLKSWRQILVVVAILTAIGAALPVSTSFAASTSFCRSYARDYSRRYAAKLPRTMSHGLLKSSLYGRAFEHCMRGEWP
jgi:hypothetical protein